MCSEGVFDLIWYLAIEILSSSLSCKSYTEQEWICFQFSEKLCPMAKTDVILELFKEDFKHQAVHLFKPLGIGNE